MGRRVMQWLLVVGALLAVAAQRPACRNCDSSADLDAKAECPPGDEACAELACCPRRPGARCTRGAHCERGLTCRYPRRGASTGICRVPTGKTCVIGPKIYHHGEQFFLDCRTQCACQNGTYACSSRCPRENIAPRSDCRRPRLVELPGHCCREWQCDGPPAQEPPKCVEESSEWSQCSAECGGGLSHRVSNANSRCVAVNETRFCQDTSCTGFAFQAKQEKLHHHVRRSHSCKATERLGASRLRAGPCLSRRRFRPRLCGGCVRPGSCCAPLRSTTIKIEMICSSLQIDEEVDDVYEVLSELMEPKKDIWLSEKVATRGFEHRKNPHRFLRVEYSQMFDVRQGNRSHAESYKRFIAQGDKYAHSVSTQWLVKCQCGPEFCRARAPARLHRVHRTAAPAEG